MEQISNIVENTNLKRDLYHYLVIKSHNSNEYLYEELKEVYKGLLQENSAYIKEVYRIMCKTKGLLEYKVSEFAEETGLTKNKIKTLINVLIDEGKMKRIVENETTFILVKWGSYAEI